MFVILCIAAALNQKILKAQLCVVIARIYMGFAVLGIIVKLIIRIVLQIRSVVREWKIYHIRINRIIRIRCPEINRVVLIRELIMCSLIIGSIIL